MKSLNGSIKLSNGQGDRVSVLGALQKGYKKLAHKVTNKHSDQQPMFKEGFKVAQIVSVIFSSIGVIASLKWVWYFFTPTSHHALIPDQGSDCLQGNMSRCPWASAFADFGKRLQNLEDAFKEQYAARISIEKGLYNQSALNSYLSSKVEVFLTQLENVSRECKRIDGRINSISSRLLADEILGFLILICIGVELYMRIRPHYPYYRELAMDFYQTKVLKKEKVKVTEEVVIETTVEPTTASEQCNEVLKPELNENETDGCNSCNSCNSSPVHYASNKYGKEEKNKKNSANLSAPSTPKHGVLREEMCVILFRRESSSIYSSVVDTLIGFVPDIALAAAPYYCIENTHDLNRIPHVKLFLLICDCNVGYSNVVTSRDLRLASIRVMHRLGADVIVVIGNDTESELLTGHRQYNSNLRLVFANEVMQDLASSGRVFSLNREMSPHQMSHLRKTVKTLMHTKRKDMNSKPRFITISK